MLHWMSWWSKMMKKLLELKVFVYKLEGSIMRSPKFILSPVNDLLNGMKQAHLHMPTILHKAYLKHIFHTDCLTFYSMSLQGCFHFSYILFTILNVGIKVIPDFTIYHFFLSCAWYDMICYWFLIRCVFDLWADQQFFLHIHPRYFIIINIPTLKINLIISNYKYIFFQGLYLGVTLDDMGKGGLFYLLQDGWGEHSLIPQPITFTDSKHCVFDHCLSQLSNCSIRERLFSYNAHKCI